ncbi:hypothetical protein D3C83_19680 [compost metagenome]
MFARIAAIVSQRDRSNRPVLLALDLERLAQPGFEADRGEGFAPGTGEKTLDPRQFQFPVRPAAVVARPEQIGNEQGNVHDGGTASLARDSSLSGPRRTGC